MNVSQKGRPKHKEKQVTQNVDTIKSSLKIRISEERNRKDEDNSIQTKPDTVNNTSSN